MSDENQIFEERMNIQTPSDTENNIPPVLLEFPQKIKVIKPAKSPKKTLVFVLSTVVVLLLLGSLFIPFASTNALSKIFSTFGNERYAIGADLLANKSVGSALSVLSFDPTKPNSCKGGWAAIKDMKVADVIANNQAINSSFAEIRVHPANKELVSGTIGTTMSTDGDTTQLGIQGSFEAELQQILDWSKQVIAVVTKNEAGQEAITSSEKQVQDIINQTGWDKLHLEAKGSLWNGANSMQILPSMLRVQLGADTVENTETKPISIISEQYQPSQSLRFELGDSQNAKLQDIVSHTTAESLLKSTCATVQSIQYGKFQTQNVNGQKFDARAVTLQLKSFSNIVEQIANDYPALGNMFTNDSKVQHFVYNLSKANQLTTDDFETFRKGISDASSQIQAPSSEMVERVKNAVSWNSKLTLYVDRSLNIVGSGGSTSLGITKGELTKDSESLGLKIPLDSIQIDELCNLLCSGLTLSGSSFRANTVFMPPSKQTQNSEDFLQHINQNKQFTNLSSKFNKLLQDNNFNMLLPSMPTDTDFSTSLPCPGYNFMYNTDGSVVCDYNSPLTTPTQEQMLQTIPKPAPIL